MIGVPSFVAVALAAVVLLMPGAALAEPVTFVKDAPLRAEARFDAAPVAQVSRGTAGVAGGKQGGWLNVKTANGTGWVLTTDISFPSIASSGASGSGFGFFGRSQPTRTTSTLGIRGFDKDTIGTAFNEGTAISAAQLKLLDDYAVDKPGGQSFASAQGLSATPIPY